MLTCRTVIPGRLGLFVAGAPFSVDDVLSTQREIIAGDHAGMKPDTPAIFDFSSVKVSDIPASELMRLVKIRRSLEAVPTTGPLAFVCSSTALLGMLRMFSILADAGGLWKENMIFVTMEPVQAVTWIATRAGLSVSEANQAAVQIAGVAGWSQGISETMQDRIRL